MPEEKDQSRYRGFKEQFANCKNGQIVVVSLIDQPTRVTPPIGKIIEVVGDSEARYGKRNCFEKV